MLQQYFSRRKRNSAARMSGWSPSKARRRWCRLWLESLETRLAPATFTEGLPFSGAVATLADPDPTAPLSAFTATINWGDGSPTSVGTITQPGGPGTNLVVSGNHTYADEANFQISVMVTESGTTANNLDLSGGFAGSTNILTYNGSATINGTVAQLTKPPTNVPDGSFFSTNLLPVSTFVSNFSFQLLNGTNPSADGITFCIQGFSPTALGPAGGGLGYGDLATTGPNPPIPNSVAVKFDLFNNAGEGNNSTGLYTDGAFPDVPAIDLTGTGIDLHSQHVFNVIMAYDGTTLNVTIKDTKTGASASQSYKIDIPGTVGGKTAYVGFTGSTGLFTATQDILSWTYGGAATNVAASVVEGDVLTATGGHSWTAVEGSGVISGTVATFTDTNLSATAADFVATINWGDGTTSTGVIFGQAGSFTVNAAHTFVDEGQLPVTVTITDDGLGTAVAVAQDFATVSETDVLTANVLSSSLVSFWQAEGNANDSTGTNNGTLQSGATFAPGHSGQAFSFDGNGYVQAGATGMPTGNNARTMAMWVNINAFGTGESWFAGYGNFGTNTQVYSIGTNPTSHTLFFSPWGSQITGPALQTGTWYYVAATNVGNSVTLYLNGVVVASGTLTMATPAGTNFYMGRIPGNLGNTRNLNGLLDEVAVFNRALSPSEIQSAMNGVFGASFRASEGSVGNRTIASFTDANKGAVPGDFAVTIDWGDGTTGPGKVAGSGGNYVVNGNHIYQEEGSFNYNVQIQDDGPGTAALAISGVATVINAPIAFTAHTSVSAVEGQSVTGTLGTFTDADPLGTATDYTATIDWGDGTTSTGTIVPSGLPSVPTLSVGPNVNLSKEPGNQNEASLAINPTNPNNIVAWSNDETALALNGGVDEYVSFDGGNTWTRKLIGANDSLENFACCDTQSVFDSFGNLYAVNIDFLNSGGSAIKVLESFDGGTTLQVVTVESSLNLLDQPSIAFGAGMVWVSYHDFGAGGMVAAGAPVTGLGQVGAFSTPELAPGSANGSFGNVAVSPTGQVIITYQSPDGGPGPSAIFVNVDPDGLGPQGFGPATLVNNVNVGGFAPIPPQPFRTIDSEANIYYDSSGGPFTGRAYLVYTDSPAVGSPSTDIFVRASDDNGTTWTAPVRITDDTSGNSHFLPQMAIDQTTGNVAVAWSDSRNAGPSDQTAQVFATVSTDGGLTWMPNVQVSAGTSNVIPSGSGIDYGDYMLMDFYAGTFRPIWSDNSNSTGDNPNGTLNALDIYSAAVTITSGPAFDVQGTHTYAEEGGPFTVKVQVTDNGSSMATTTSQSQVLDAPLTPQGIQFTSSEQANYTGRVASFSDGNPTAPLTDFSATIDWGDGHHSVGTISPNSTGGFDVSGSNTYADEGTFAVSVTIQDLGGSKVTAKSTATIMDLPLTATGVSLTTVEPKGISGQVGIFQDTLTNASLADFSTGQGGATIDWGDGSPVSVGFVTQPGGKGTPFVVSGSHGYAGEGSFLVTVTLTDEGGSSVTAISHVTITDAPLLALGIVNPQPTEGKVFNGQLAAFLDTNPLAPLSDFTTGSGGASVDWGDGSPATAGTITQPLGPGTGFLVSGNHTYLDEGSYTIHITATDVGGAVFQALVAAVVSDAALTGSGVAVNAFEGVSFTTTVANFVDANPFAPLSDFPTNRGAVRIDWGDGIASRGTVSQPGGTGTPFVVSGSHTYAQVGVYTIQMTAPDVGGNRATASTTATVVDAPLTVVPASFSLSEAALFSGTVATFTDANAAAPLADFTSGTGGATLDWGDGSPLTTATITQPQGVGTAFLVNSSHLYKDEGTYTIKVTVKDRRGSQAQATFTTSMADAPLTAAGIPLQRHNGLNYTGQLATVTDANLTASLTDFTTGTAGATIDWGDGTPTSVGTVTQPGGPGTAFIVQGSHTYSQLGTYAINVTVQDIGGSNAAASTSLTVAHWDDLVGRSSQSGQWTVAVSNGANAFTSAAFGTWDPTQTWVDVQTGDFNGDGRTDIIGRDLQTGDVWVGLSNGSTFTMTKWAHWSPAVTWVDVKVGDFDGDGTADIAGRVAQSGEWWVGLSTGSSFTTTKWTTWSTAVSWVDVQVGDFNGDGKADIAGRVVLSGEWWVAQSSGSAFSNAKWTTWSTAVTWVDVRVGDFNGDGKADIIGRVAQSGEWWEGQATGSSFTTNLWGVWSPSLTWVDVQVGDFNGDGKSDLAGLALQTGEWRTSLSTGTSSITSVWGVWSQPNSWVDVHAGDFA